MSEKYEINGNRLLLMGEAELERALNTPIPMESQSQRILIKCTDAPLEFFEPILNKIDQQFSYVERLDVDISPDTENMIQIARNYGEGVENFREALNVGLLIFNLDLNFYDFNESNRGWADVVVRKMNLFHKSRQYSFDDDFHVHECIHTEQNFDDHFTFGLGLNVIRPRDIFA